MIRIPKSSCSVVVMVIFVLSFAVFPLFAEVPPPPTENETHPSISKTEVAALFSEKLSPEEVETMQIIPTDEGLTASTFIIETNDKKYIIKLLDRDTPLSNVLKEMWVSQLASEKAIGPEIVRFDLDRRAILMAFSEGVHPKMMDIENPSTRSSLEKLQRLHRSISLSPFSSIYNRLSKADEKGLVISKKMKEAHEEVKALERLIKSKGTEPTLCHGDFHCKNIITKEKQATLIDWGSSSFGYPFYDIAKLTYGMSGQEALALFAVYLETSPTKEQEAEFFLMRSLVHISIATNRLLKGSDNKLIEELVTTFLFEINSEKGKRYKNVLQP